MEETKKLLVTIAVFGVLTLLFLGAVFYQAACYGYGFLAFDDAYTIQIANKQQELAKLERRNTVDRDKAQARLEELESLKDLSEQLLPDIVKTRELLNAIANKGKGLVQVNEIKPVVDKTKGNRQAGRAAANQPQYEPIVYDMEITGTFDEISTFINVMEMFELPDEDGKNKVQFFAVQDISIEADSDGMTESGRHVVKLKLVTYQYIPAATPAKPATPAAAAAKK